jgi:hypothetical protein
MKTALTNSMGQSPSSEDSCCSPAQEIPSIFMEPEGPLPCSHLLAIELVLSQINPVHVLKLHLLKIHNYVIFPSLPRSLPIRFLTKMLYPFTNSLIRATYLANLIILDLFTQIIFMEVYKLWISSLLPRRNPNLDSHPMSAVRDSVFNIFSISGGHRLHPQPEDVVPWWQATHCICSCGVLLLDYGHICAELWTDNFQVLEVCTWLNFLFPPWLCSPWRTLAASHTGGFLSYVDIW